MGVVIVTDSTANIEPSYTELYNIKVVSLSVNFPDLSFKEIEIDNKEFYKLMEKYPAIPTSSQPSPADFYKVFEEAVSQGHSVVGLFISAGLSGTYSSAITASRMIIEKYPQAEIELIDSGATIMQLGYGVLAAAQAAREGDSTDQVARKGRQTLERSRLYFVPKTLEYLKKGGRIGQAAALVGTILKIKPILHLSEGKVAVYDKVRTFEKALNKILGIFDEEYQTYGINDVTVQHINNLNEAHKVAQYIREKYNITPHIVSIRAVIGVHAGPGAVGLSYVVGDFKE